jgi:hypothetical protein
MLDSQCVELVKHSSRQAFSPRFCSARADHMTVAIGLIERNGRSRAESQAWHGINAPLGQQKGTQGKADASNRRSHSAAVGLTCSAD